MILSESMLFVSPETSLFQGFGTLNSPPGYPAKPVPELPELLELLELVELLELPIPAEPELELVDSPPVPPVLEVAALPLPPDPLLLSLGPHADADVTSHATRMPDDATAQRTGFVVSISRHTPARAAREDLFFDFSRRRGALKTEYFGISIIATHDVEFMRHHGGNGAQVPAVSKH